AVGKALAVFLKLEGKNVCIIRGRIDNTPTQMETISIQMDEGITLRADLEVSSLSSHVKFDGILVITSKSFGNEYLAETLSERAVNQPIVLLQNGLGVESAFVNKGFSDIHRCVLFTTCQVMGDNLVRFTPVAESLIGKINGKLDSLNHITNQLNNPIFKFRVEENIQSIIWKKAIANCVFNSICPLLDTDNGIFLRNVAVMNLGQTVIKECVNIANISGVEISENEVIESVKIISKMSDGQLISTLQDINNRRPTEIETLNFAIVAIAQRYGKENDVTQTKLLGELTKMKADLNIAQ
ncbi:ketopantoate reductase family protein, partial [Lacihabitans sp. CS3-21]|uniref:ketopantoate reductase family protein n=1 Tax=Lacihabitans sp. CS3-21 TaxID=2487332 RepID=UPI0020CCD9AA